MSTGPTALPEPGESAGPERGRRLPRLRDARIRSKLALILVVPVAAVVLLATMRLVSTTEGAVDATQIRSLTALSIEVSALTQDLHKERMAAAAFLANPQLRPDDYNLRVRATGERVNSYRAERTDLGEVPTAVRDRLTVIDDHLRTLDATRQEVLDRRQMPVAEATLRYGVILTDLVSYGDTLAQLSGQESLADARRAVAAFSRAKAAVAEEEAVAYTALVGGRLDEEQFSSFVATLTSQQEALLGFSLAADPTQRALVDGAVSGDAVGLADRVAADITRSVGQRSPVSAGDASASIGAVNDLMRWTEIQLQDTLLARSEQARSDVIQQAVIESVLVLLTLITAITLAVVLARSLNHSLRRLREGALSVANHDLPDAVKRLQNMGSVSDGGVEEIVRQVRDPIRLTNRDEVGQVALAFNVVHREAVRVAAEQAALRTSVSAMFLNLARRSQTLVDKMIGELDAIERGEEDPKRLAQLFELDHLATRMRRNDENLLVLAGADSAVPRRDDALLVDVLRAAQSEVELYNRIEFGTVDTDISVAAHAVNDVVRLVAELLDNATRFSSPTTTVVADGRRIRDYVLIQIEDRGLGLTDEQLDSLNRRLAAPPTVDVAAFRLMGLAVVSRLAGRYSIRVELRRNVEGGTVAQVTLPNATVVLPAHRGRDQAVNRPRQPLAVEQPAPATTGIGNAFAGARSAAATLTDQWRTTPPAPAAWQSPVDARDTAPAVQFGGPVSAPPLTPVSAPAADSGFSAFSAGSPTVANPTIDPLPRRAAPAEATPVLPVGPVAGALAAPTTADSYGGPAMPFAGTPAAGPYAGAPAAAPYAGAPAAGPYAGAPAAGPFAGAPAATPFAGAPAATPFAAPAASSYAAPAAPYSPPAASYAPPTPAAPVVARPDRPADSPIFREMEAVWFRSHGDDATAIFTRPRFDDEPPAAPARSNGAARPSRPPLPTRVPAAPTAAGTPTVTPAPAPAEAPAVTVPDTPAATVPPTYATTDAPPAPPHAATEAPAAPAGGDSEAWRTAADEGWSRASQAAEPASAGTTRSGLPKRVPQAQLVPGGIEPKGGRDRSRRTPDEVRGLLSAYHRGVQRGRTAGADLNSTSTKETNR
ncbi:sensor histidine kinase [Micromonospora rifamycinica]|uniref:histidine kinase n=1 Tax=Micromonospora rifamycinica TaxID=291594 RepID=A0A109IGY3_9ACTN|nr:nitrate- and nitrite sensing domain-containing protein [Micromonospora rifamycinica]KWV30387.1 ATPase [Micromonospora rifamycinica]SCG79014.1 Signal transduction histidine kinase [Micromonospora rifamycinica]